MSDLPDPAMSERAELAAKIRAGFAGPRDLVGDAIRAGVSSPEEVRRYLDAQMVRAEAVTLGVEVLVELGVDPRHLAELMSKGPEAAATGIAVLLQEFTVDE